MGDETGGKAPKSTEGVTAPTGQEVHTSQIPTSSHFSLFVMIDFDGKAYDPTLITPHKQCMSRDIPKYVEKEWHNASCGSTATGYMTQEMFEVVY